MNQNTSDPREAAQPRCLEMMETSSATPEHAWLRRFAGDWQAKVEGYMDSDTPGFVTHGEEHSRMLGDLWVLAEGRNLSFPYAYQLTLGFDPARGRYIATWTDTMLPHLWTYDGTLDPEGRILTMDTEGPDPAEPGRRARFREVTEFRGEDERVFTSSRQGLDGRWILCMRVELRRKG